jgi:hypothetical protein
LTRDNLNSLDFRFLIIEKAPPPSAQICPRWGAKLYNGRFSHEKRPFYCVYSAFILVIKSTVVDIQTSSNAKTYAHGGLYIVSRFRGMSTATFFLHLKECVFRFNYRDQNLYKIDAQNCTRKSAVLVMTVK